MHDLHKRCILKYLNASDAEYISLLTFTGQFAIRPDKKSEPKVRKFRHVGMISGGTGNDGHIFNGLQSILSRFPGVAAKITNRNMYKLKRTRSFFQASLQCCS